ncbi:MAG: FlgD immunoglobulin-like domain containing protein, partial [Elusimicrobiota bacterium]
ICYEIGFSSNYSIKCYYNRIYDRNDILSIDHELEIYLVLDYVSPNVSRPNYAKIKTNNPYVQILTQDYLEHILRYVGPSEDLNYVDSFKFGVKFKPGCPNIAQFTIELYEYYGTSYDEVPFEIKVGLVDIPSKTFNFQIPYSGNTRIRITHRLGGFDQQRTVNYLTRFPLWYVNDNRVIKDEVNLGYLGKDKSYTYTWIQPDSLWYWQYWHYWIEVDDGHSKDVEQIDLGKTQEDVLDIVEHGDFSVSFESPTVYNVNISRNSFSSDESISINYTISENGYSTLKIYDEKLISLIKTIINNKSQNRGTNSETWNGKNEDGDDAPSGKYVCKISVKDISGKLGEGETSLISFSDVIPPDISNVYTLPKNISISNSHCNIYFTPSEKADVKLDINNSQSNIPPIKFLDTYSKGEHSFYWDGKDGAGIIVPDDFYLFKLNATDISGNIALEKTGIIIVDRTAPTISDVTITPGIFSPTLGQSAQISFKATDNFETLLLKSVTVQILDTSDNLIKTLYATPADNTTGEY